MNATYAYFTKEELDCDHCGESHMDEQFMNMVIALREQCGFQFVVSSVGHSGKDMEIKVHGKRAYLLLKEAMQMGFIGVGIKQNEDPSGSFIHLDMDTSQPNRPWVWSY